MDSFFSGISGIFSSGSDKKTQSTKELSSVPLSRQSKKTIPLSLENLTMGLNAPEGTNIAEYGADEYNKPFTWGSRPTSGQAKTIYEQQRNEKKEALVATYNAIADRLAKPVTEKSWCGNKLVVTVDFSGSKMELFVTPDRHSICFEAGTKSESINITLQDLIKKVAPFKTPRDLDHMLDFVDGFDSGAGDGFQDGSFGSGTTHMKPTNQTNLFGGFPLSGGDSHSGASKPVTPVPFQPVVINRTFSSADPNPFAGFTAPIPQDQGQNPFLTLSTTPDQFPGSQQQTQVKVPEEGSDHETTPTSEVPKKQKDDDNKKETVGAHDHDEVSVHQGINTGTEKSDSSNEDDPEKTEKGTQGKNSTPDGHVDESQGTKVEQQPLIRQVSDGSQDSSIVAKPVTTVEDVGAADSKENLVDNPIQHPTTVKQDEFHEEGTTNK